MQSKTGTRPFDAKPRVLLVEDNEINQEIVGELLRELEAEVTCADNGEQAVAAFARDAFDIILMDIEMPIMDGLEATRRIRSGLSAHAARVPIVAMTGHSEQGDRERFLAAGMNDHLVKPIDPQALRKLFAVWVAAPAGAAAVSDITASRRRLQTLYGINVDAGIANVAGNEKLYLDLLHRFATKYHDSHAELPLLVQAGDMEGATRLAHTIKGVAANLGAIHLADLVKHIETALMNDASILPLLAPYQEELAAVTQAIERLVAKDEAAITQKVPTVLVDEALVPRILELLDGLPMLMQTDWGRAQEQVEELGALLEHTEAGGDVAKLRNALEEFDVVAFTGISGTLTGHFCG